MPVVGIPGDDLETEERPFGAPDPVELAEEKQQPPRRYETDVTPLVQEWIDGASANYGVQLVSTTVPQGLNVIFDSREGANVPELHVEYIEP